MASGVPSPQPEDHGFPVITKGINLPKSEEQWLTANEYFKSVLLRWLVIPLLKISGDMLKRSSAKKFNPPFVFHE